MALSRLFQVPVGWLLGVEEPQTDGAENAGADPGSVPETGSGELTEVQLNMVEEIVERYTAALPKPRRRRWPFVLAGLVLIIVFSNLFQSLDTLRLQQESIFNDISRVESSVNSQIGSISSQVEDILKAQNSLVADGCIIEGTVENSVLFRGVRVGKGAVVKDCILMQSVEVQDGAQLSHVISDKNAFIKRDRRIVGQESYPVVIEKNAVI